MWVAFANAKATHIIFSKNISKYAILNDNFDNTLTNDIISFEQLDPVFLKLKTVIYLGLWLHWSFMFVLFNV